VGDEVISVSQNLLSLQGKVALITGASTGLGEHFAHIFAAAGAAVVVAARRQDRIDAVAAAIRNSGGRALAIAMDVTERASVKAAFDAAEQQFGVVDIVVCNAGLGGGTPFLQMSEQCWDDMIAVNLKGVWSVGQEAAQRLVAAAKPGSIINISSILGLQAFPAFAHYCAAKSGVIQLSRVMALELAQHRIRVNAVAPGYFETDMTRDYYQTEAGRADVAKVPMQRLGEFHELDGQMLLLASDAASYMTGGTYTVDGAHSARLG
jgi:NAD(P)-dependent dehydrogenase (short-subunit alcohol dehydrogenase family)